jgi:hypothetical protein
MGVESDQEILGLVGSEPAVAALLAPTLQDAKSMGIFIRQQALEYLGTAPVLHGPTACHAALYGSSFVSIDYGWQRTKG